MKGRKTRFFICSILAALLTLTFSFTYPLKAIQSGDGIAIFILDNSGSMAEDLHGETKLITAKKAIKEVVNDPSLNTVNMGLMELGGYCEVKELIKPGLHNREKLTTTIDLVQPRPYLDASTPIAEAIYEASESIRKHRNIYGQVPARIVLISDGEANCMKKEEFPLRPCDMVASLKNQNILFDLTLVNYAIASKKDKELECIARLSDNSIVIDPENLNNTSTIIGNDIGISVNTNPPETPKSSSYDLEAIGRFLTGLAALIGAIWVIVVYFLNNNDPPSSNQNQFY